MPPTAGELELRERLRLEAIERRARSLRAPSVVQTFRGDEPQGTGSERREAEAAAGAVGLLAGLTLQGSDPYAGGGAGFRAAAGQGFGQSATQVLGRFLNRLPAVTIRAGHRLRVWLTADLLAPRPAPHPERMYRK